MMLFSYKKISLFIISVTALLIVASCGPVGDDDGGENGTGTVSNSTSSSETGGNFTVDPYNGTWPHTASVVIGQANFENFGDEDTAADTVSTPYGNPTVVDGVLYLPDFNNNRVLGYNTVPITNGKWANFIVGQNSFHDSLYGSSEYRNEGAQSVTVATGKLFVTDWGNSRILIYNKRPIGEPAKADIIVGQTDFDLGTTGLANNRLNLPESLFVAGDKLIVADSKNHRVLIWNNIPTAHGVAADIVLGQSDFDSNTVEDPPTQRSLNFPTGIWSDGTKLIVLDTGNNRILVWNDISTISDGELADTVLGQSIFSDNSPNQGNGDTPSAASLSFSTDGGGLYSNGTQLFVADSGNHRILVWDDISSLSDNQDADGLIGQNNFDQYLENRGSGGIGITGRNTFSNPTGVYQFSNKLIVTDTGNNRYLIFNSK